jgi:hypothetical protein
MALDDFSEVGDVIEVVGPGLHHAAAVIEVLGPVVSGIDLVARGMGKLAVFLFGGGRVDSLGQHFPGGGPFLLVF